ncbi:trypsin-like peptidase domain-containing protein [Planktothrix sp. FACHB-1355]|uniref:Trypsin-like peptidase domain-containing protein n=1 Tax=Aerosakkonema funiforme FACHB-1375 TaxID=2949571 RepID=A0A926VCU7_9CYAN|nr:MULTISPECIES: trypsin-like peptidase domain-containing protein [Oscillatoriales]MBD2181436.1 trypsin-like peptidase domain-containing protein [Aerosakkonema funiforme FACHB-1375]MBD3557701.1 trypsin-like peptidase domain-containing protein [Planktothrix sp. FACHB-1355]
MKFSFPDLAVAIGAAAIVIVQSQIAVPQEQQSLNDKAIGDMARDVTVLINGQNPGSGVIIAKQGNTYSVLTAKHVVATQDEYEIFTSDATKYPLNYANVKKLPGIDLAIVQFTSNKNYRVAELGDSDKVTEGATVYTAGWPRPGRAINQAIYQITKGSISGRPLQALDDGYGLVYTNITRTGMSGGPVFDSQGQVVGIHGRGDGEPIFNPETGATVDVKSGFNLAIPINTYFKLAPGVGINLLYLGDNFVEANKIAGHSNAISSVAISQDGTILASGSMDNTIKIWNRSTGKELRTLTGHTNYINSIAISPDSKILASGANDGTVKIWNLANGRLINSLTGDKNYVRSVAISPDGTTLASGSANDANIKIWNLQTGKLLRTLTGHRNYVNAVDFSADGKSLASGSTDLTINIWNPNTGELQQTLKGHTNWIASVAIGSFGQIIASGGADNTIKIWNVKTGEMLYNLQAHSGVVRAVAIDPNAHILASGSDDGTIKIWNLHNGQLLHTLQVRDRQGQIASVNSLAFSNDGQILISNAGASLRIWQVKR